MSTLTAKDVADRLKGKRQAKGYYLCRCPCPTHSKGRGDRNPSLTVDDGEDGWLVVKCYTGCSREQIYDALHYEPPSPNGSYNGYTGPKCDFNSAGTKWNQDKLNGALNQPAAPKEPERPQESIPFSDRGLISQGYQNVATYSYTDPDGVVLYEVRRYEHQAKKKEFRQRCPDGNGGWLASAGTRKVPYRWPEVANAFHETVYVTEGEKDADRLASLGFVATTVASGSWSQEAIEALAGRDCFILEDNDPGGRKRATEAATALRGVAASVRVVALPGLPYGKDVSDWLDVDPERQAWLPDLCKTFPLWTPSGDEPDETADKDGQVGDKSLPFDAFDDIDVDVQKAWILKGILAHGETSAWVGPPGATKSGLKTDITVHVAAGLDWRGYRCKERCAVVYFAFERAALVKRRLEAYRRKYGFKELPIAVVATIVDLLSPASVKIFVDTIRAVEKRFGLPVGLIVLDTWSKALAYGGGDENSAKDQNRALGHLRDVERETDVHAALVGHTGKDLSKGHRGSNANPADVDVEIVISGDDTKIATITKQNDGPEGLLTSYVMEPFDFGPDEDGDPVTTWILSNDVPDKSGQKSKPKRLNHGEQVAMNMLREALSEAGMKPPASNYISGQVPRVVTTEMWRTYCYQGGISPGGTTEDAKQKAFVRALKSLQTRELVKVWGQYVWPVADDAT